MKKILSAVCLAALALAWSGCETTSATPSPKGKVVVNYVEPEKFTDLKYSGFGTEQGFLVSLRDYLVAEGGKYLTPDQTLTLTFTDIDMAGEIGMNARNSDVRVMKGNYPMRLEFSYTLTDASGKVLKQGQEKLVEMFPATQMGTNRSDPLFHEKTKLADWMRANLK